MEPEEENNSRHPTLEVNFNLIKVNAGMVILCVILSLFKQEYEYIRFVYNSLITILIYNNLVFGYIVYKNLRNL
jgi:hypothetical protein